MVIFYFVKERTVLCELRARTSDMRGGTQYAKSSTGCRTDTIKVKIC